MPLPRDHFYFHIATSPGVAGAGDVRYMVLDQHGGTCVPAEILGALDPSRRRALHAHIRREADLGAPELVRGILDRVPGGLAVHARVSRGLVDLNRLPHSSCPHLESFLGHDPSCQRLARRWAHEWYDHFRGAWQLPVPDASPRGLLEALHAALPPEVPVWDFHTMDPTDADRQPRPLVQTFSACRERPDAPTEELVPQRLNRAVAGILETSSALRRAASNGAPVCTVDHPYHFYPGCTPEQVARRRPVLATDLRKDLLGPGWAEGRFDEDRLQALLEPLAAIVSILNDFQPGSRVTG